MSELLYNFVANIEFKILVFSSVFNTKYNAMKNNSTFLRMMVSFQYLKIVMALLLGLWSVTSSGQFPGDDNAPGVAKTFTIPANVTHMNAAAWGAGGGGGGSASRDEGGNGGGGGGASSNQIAVAPGNIFTYTLTAGGAGGTSNAGAGGNGGSTTIVATTPAVNLTATGGTGGLGDRKPLNYPTNSGFGSGSGGINSSGQNGTMSITKGEVSGNGGNSGTAFGVFGIGGAGVIDKIGKPGGNPGAGGSGGDRKANPGASDFAGGPGAPGRVMFDYITVSGVTPSPVCIGGTITITGTNFSTSGITTVSVNGIACSSITVVNATTITAIVGSGSTDGVVDINNNGRRNNGKSITLNPSPAAIGGGAATVCTGTSTNPFTNATGGGTWSTSNGNATINASGVLSGVNAGTTNVIYTLPTGCSVTSGNITVQQTPGAITAGAAIVCNGTSTPAFTNPNSGGTWTVVNGTGSATITTGGVLTGTGVGSVTVKYTIGSCVPASYPVTVTAFPVIDSQPVATSICTTGSGTLSVSATGGTTYQWRRAGVPLTNVAPYNGVDTPSLTITTPTAGFAGNFDVVVGNGTCSVTSTAVPLTVTTVPATVTTPSPANNATGICYAGIGSISSISWGGASGASSYDVYFGAVSIPGTVTANVITNTYNTGVLAANTTYFWRIVSKNSCGDAISSATWSFTTTLTPCYCTSTGTTFPNGITGVQFNSINNLGTPVNTGYTDYTTTISTTVVKGFSYYLNVYVSTGGNYSDYQSVYIDWNGDGDFGDAGEFFNLGTATNVANGPTSLSPLSITVPAGALSGPVRMRVQSRYNNPTNDPCRTGFDGEVEDYTIIISDPVSCSGTPIGGTTVLNPTSGAPSSVFNASVIGSTEALELTYQWESAPTAAGVWTDIIGATSSTATITASNIVEATTYYRRKITCNNAGLSAYSTVVSYVTDYCAATTIPRAQNLYINDVSFVGTLTDQSNINNGNSANGYQNFTTLPPAVQADGRVMNITATVAGTRLARGSWKAWVDWNNDGDFTDAAELVYTNYGYLSPTAIFGFIVPAGQTPGNYRLRLRVNNYLSNGTEFLGSDFGPCDDFTSVDNNNGDFGETEDYLIKIIYNCPAKITGVNINPTDGHICGTGSVTLTATATAGATINWYSSLTNPNPIYVGGTFATPDISASQYYYVTASSGGCETVFRQPVLARIDPAPNVSFTTDAVSICGDETTQLKLTTAGDKYVDTVIDEKFVSSLGAFQQVTSSGYFTDANVNWLNKPSPYKPVNPPYPILKPALSSGFYGENFAIIDTDVTRTVSVLNHLVLTNSINGSAFIAASMKLDFDLYYYSSTTNQATNYFKVDYSVDGGTVWVNLSTITTNQGDPNTWSKQTVTLPPACYTANLKIRFSGFGGSTNTGWYANIAAIDNVKMYGDKNLTAAFNWSGNTAVLYDGATCSVPIGSSASNTVCIKPDATQLESDASWTITAITSFSNGCPATGTITINNETKIWNSPSTDWASSNWKPGGASVPPTADKCVVIKTPVVLGIATNGLAKNLTVQDSGNLTIEGNLTVTDFVKNTTGDVARLTLKSDANLLQINPSKVINFGNITAERRVTNIDYNPGTFIDYVFWSSPVAGQQTKGVGGFSPGTPNNRFFDYRESNDKFYETPDLVFAAAKGYAVQAETNLGTPYLKTYSFKGALNNGDFGITITRSADNPVGTVHGYNMVGNPYPSNIDFTKLFEANNTLIYNTVWFWTNASYEEYQQGSTYSGNNYAMFNGTGGNPSTGTIVAPNGIVKVGQGFIVQKKGAVGSGSLSFKNSYGLGQDLRVSTNGTFYQKNSGNSNRYWLRLLSPDQVINSQLIGYVEGATNDFEQDYDAEAFGLSSNLFYSFIGTNYLLIQGKGAPFSVEDRVPLGANFFQNGNYTISLGDAEGIFKSNQTIYLVDKQTGTVTNLSQGSYTFAATKGDSNGRFEIIYRPEVVLVTESISKEGIVVYRDSDNFVILSPKLISNVDVYDASGRLITVLKPNKKQGILDASVLPNGMYVLKIITADGAVTNKKIAR